jgi:hypothetical protein
MEKGTLAREIAELREQWDAVIASLGPEGLERPGATGEWRVRDVLAHCNAWDRWQLVQLRCAFTGETPTDEDLTGGITYPPNDDMQEDAMNAMFIAGTKDLPLDEILRHWREVTEMRADWVAQADQEQLETTIGADWASGSQRIFRLAAEVPTVTNPEPVWARLLDQLEHQRRHLELVQDWMRAPTH